MHALRLVDAFEDVIRLGKTGLDIAELENRVLGDVSRRMFVQL